MSERLDPRRRLIVVDARLRGPHGLVRARLMVDTGAVLTMLRPHLLEEAGYDLAAPRTQRAIIGVAGSAVAPLFVLESLAAMGHERPNLAALGYSFASVLPFDGLLGANFLSGRRLLVDYQRGIVQLDQR